jgi:transcription initiation factor IIE alpha subunit
MKKILVLFIALTVCSAGSFAQDKAGKKDTTQRTALYACPMHPEVTGHEPGTCPKCGMALSLSGKEQMKAKTTRNYVCPAHTEVTSHHADKCPKCGKKLNLSVKEQMKAEVTKVYTCSMHPDVALDKNGVCPKCGKELIEKLVDKKQ